MTPSILSISALSTLTGVPRSTLHAWIVSDPKWRGCIVKQSRRKYWLSRQKLQDIGALARTEPKAPTIGFTYTTQAIA